jgi:hemerythrin-like domain-containing protein
MSNRLLDVAAARQRKIMASTSFRPGRRFTVPIDAQDMTLVHRVFRREFHDFPQLIAAVPAGATARARVVADHLNFMVDGLHHHHAAEDELAWPILLQRAPAQHAEIQRMEAQHGGIAAAINNVQSDLSAWTKAADRSSTDQLLASVAEMSWRVAEHLDDEERNAVPVIEEHLTQDEWQAVIKRGASFLSSHPRLGIALGGLVLDYASPDEARRFLAGVPLPQRLLLRLLSPRMTASYRRRLYALP